MSQPKNGHQWLDLPSARMKSESNPLVSWTQSSMPTASVDASVPSIHTAPNSPPVTNTGSWNLLRTANSKRSVANKNAKQTILLHLLYLELTFANSWNCEISLPTFDFAPPSNLHVKQTAMSSVISLKDWDDTKANASLPRATMDLESLFSHEWSQGQA